MAVGGGRHKDGGDGRSLIRVTVVLKSLVAEVNGYHNYRILFVETNYQITYLPLFICLIMTKLQKWSLWFPKISSLVPKFKKPHRWSLWFQNF